MQVLSQRNPAARRRLERSRFAVALCVGILLACTSGASERAVNDRSSNSTSQWRLSLYPSGHTFAFTIVHDADSAYSQRLAPLFEQFDALKLKITVTVFVFWADWGHQGGIWSTWDRIQDPSKKWLAPKGVPLVDEGERAFYLNLAARGHEIGMHTPSDTSDTAEQLQEAFNYFSKVFGHPPTIYVEHSHASNLETFENQGRDAKSGYYSLATLKLYHPWVWVDGPLGLPSNDDPHYYDLIASKGAPFSNEEAKRYQYEKVFARTGKWRLSDGDGFLQAYSESNVDDLERNRGIALVYTHLDSRWLDPQTRKMRTSLAERLRYISSKNGWFVPAGEILDRVMAMRNLALDVHGGYVHIRNRGEEAIKAVTVISPAGAGLCQSQRILHPGPLGDIVVGDIRANESLIFRVCH